MKIIGSLSNDMRTVEGSAAGGNDERDYAIARLLAHRYGDGVVYIPREGGNRALLEHAVADGFVSADGFVTRKGRNLLARKEFLVPPWVS